MNQSNIFFAKCLVCKEKTLCLETGKCFSFKCFMANNKVFPIRVSFREKKNVT